MWTGLQNVNVNPYYILDTILS